MSEIATNANLGVRGCTRGGTRNGHQIETRWGRFLHTCNFPNLPPCPPPDLEVVVVEVNMSDKVQEYRVQAGEEDLMIAIIIRTVSEEGIVCPDEAEIRLQC